VDPRADLDYGEDILYHTGTLNSDPSFVQPLASRYTDRDIPAFFSGRRGIKFLCLDRVMQLLPLQEADVLGLAS
jgi:hypothetical protein